MHEKEPAIIIEAGSVDLSLACCVFCIVGFG